MALWLVALTQCTTPEPQSPGESTPASIAPAASAEPEPEQGSVVHGAQPRMVPLARVEGYANPATGELWMRTIEPQPQASPPDGVAVQSQPVGYCEVMHDYTMGAMNAGTIAFWTHPEPGVPTDAFNYSLCIGRLPSMADDRPVGAGYDNHSTVFTNYGVGCARQHVGNYTGRDFERVMLDVDIFNGDLINHGPYGWPYTPGDGLPGSAQTPTEGRNRPYQDLGLWDFGPLADGETADMWIYFKNGDSQDFTWTGYLLGQVSEVCANGMDDDCDGVVDNGCGDVAPGGGCFEDSDCSGGNFCVGAMLLSGLGEGGGTLADDVAGVCACDVVDADADGLGDSCDNCPATANMSQVDGDADGLGDACDACPNDALNDADGDGVCGDVDNCPVSNPGQLDSDADGAGDACDACPNDPDDDIDGDGVCGDVDNCPAVSNAGQANDDGDALGNACDPCVNDSMDDVDGDGLCADVDNCPGVPNIGQANADGDALGDACDSCPSDPDDDIDGDGVCGDVDNCPGLFNMTQADSDGDGLGNACDSCIQDPDNDIDGDGVCGDVDNCPALSNIGQANADGDGLGDACDSCPNDPDDDIDGDGVCGDLDNCPALSNIGQANADGDALGDACDSCPNDPLDDQDNDTICGDVDNCPAQSNPGQENADGDGLGDVCDSCANDPLNDQDADGRCGDVDNCPATPNSPQADDDGDGAGNVCDSCPLDPDNDIDGDGRCANLDNCPTIPNAGQLDTDGNGVGDACDVPPEWVCERDYWFADDGCDCGCGAVDLDCLDSRAISCDHCNDYNGCGGGFCPGNVDPLNNAVCGGVPPGWTCDPSYYGDGGCDCGCGVVDELDCATNNADQCEYCNDVGSCGNGTCPANIAPMNSATCVLPPGWTCDPQHYGSGDACHCGCGIPDPDCLGGTAADCDICGTKGSCSGEFCVGIDPNANERCVPADWNCDPGWFGTGNGCDCGCGVQDPDCVDFRDASCDTCLQPGSCSGQADCSDIQPRDNATCEVPVGWTCAPAFYGDGGCDCGCGIVDSDCADPDGAGPLTALSIEVCAYCDGLGSCSRSLDCTETNVHPDNNAVCTPDGSWTCDPALYLDGTCHCGCGILDPDCTDGRLGSCEVCNGGCSGMACAGSPNIDPNQNWKCTVPPGWTCDPTWYGDGGNHPLYPGCHCGCGAFDPDCVDPDGAGPLDEYSSAACDYCGLTAGGGCVDSVTGVCPDDIDPVDNTRCL